MKIIEIAIELTVMTPVQRHVKQPVPLTLQYRAT